MKPSDASNIDFSRHSTRHVRFNTRASFVQTIHRAQIGVTRHFHAPCDIKCLENWSRKHSSLENSIPLTRKLCLQKTYALLHCRMSHKTIPLASGGAGSPTKKLPTSESACTQNWFTCPPFYPLCPAHRPRLCSKKTISGAIDGRQGVRETAIPPYASTGIKNREPLAQAKGVQEK